MTLQPFDPITIYGERAWFLHFINTARTRAKVQFCADGHPEWVSVEEIER